MALRFSVRQLLLGLALVQVAFGLRLAAAHWWQGRLEARYQAAWEANQERGGPQVGLPDRRFGFGDSEGYWELARAISHGETYEYEDMRVFRTPGYPVLLAPLFWFAAEREDPPVLWARYLGAVLGTLTVAGAMVITGTLFDERAAWIAGLIATFYPPLIATSIFVLSEAPYLPVFLLHLWLWIKAVQASSQRAWLGWSAAAGLTCAVAVLIRPSWLLFLPFAAGLIVCCVRERGKHVQIAALMAAAFCVAMSPWWVRNYAVTGKFVATTLQVGISLADGLNANADGGSDYENIHANAYRRREVDLNGLYVVPPRYHVSLPSADGLPQRDLGEIEYELTWNNFYRSLALEWARDNPGRVLQLAGIKFLRLWNVVPNAAEFGGRGFQILYAVTYTPLLVCSLAAIWHFRRRGVCVWLLILPAVYFTLLHMIFVASIRYQLPGLLAWSILASGWLSERAGKIFARSAAQ